jgi:hypothetical protein
MGKIKPHNGFGGAAPLNLADSIKSFALNAVDNSSPLILFYGIVKQANPLIINVDQRFDLEEDKLILSSLVQDFEADVDLIFSTEDETHTHDVSEGTITENTHNHLISGVKTVTFRLGLKAGERVLLLRKQGGEKFLVIDRLR